MFLLFFCVFALKTMSGKMCSSSSSVIQAQKLVDQLRVEASMERFKISLTAADLVQYCQEHRRSDPLLTGIAASSNPFKDKKTCLIL
ncbi:guanine nucleotide-binding protein G(I)/G(S)/G(O) subunit gamma-7-like isoform X1 [Astatotilapia calliptera]|nr:guanine nucleotide-binding protein G(I)/G(S)/G(O) subunit gamma-7-like isoform X1 [Astatotilapia calliptera]XP_039908810.1 guanine nucleotide-binding protein G(I)/G(S)/G(O) subunit gamma-7-like isoform X1 [Simochromis diagramma]